ncbi:dihydrodipicolinate synthase family protein [Vibrio sp. ZSDZ34]|uniref:Dihydrodipicolinate synthase family protein n=1 Tax=Vibrio gelatinilyticus TaxID=2893468 RepID=A0A9X1WC94_9VIBR|nr:dihydrodipicolinate synthase family protein [Vibrio gelatinilyticus]MCJ2377644.1 dihydrodipicolinate synthase family protein [Vibrio gelatinilyticus]
MKGIYCPSVVLFDQDKKLDIEANKAYWQRLASSNIDGVVILGTIGENTELSYVEKVRLIEAANAVFSQTSTKLIVGGSSTLIKETIDLVQLCNDMPAVDAILSMPAFYFGLTQASVKSHLSMVCETSLKPVIAYNFPDRNGIDISIDTLAELKVEFDNFSGVKNTSKNIESTMLMISRLEDQNFTVYAGFDEHFLPALFSGGTSVISGLVNVIPDTFVSLVNAFQTCDVKHMIWKHRMIIDQLHTYQLHPHFVAAIKNKLKESELINNSIYRGVY